MPMSEINLGCGMLSGFWEAEGGAVGGAETRFTFAREPVSAEKPHTHTHRDLFVHEKQRGALSSRVEKDALPE